MSVGHYENFPVASMLCPRALRAPIKAIYAFARTADDIADEGEATPERRLADLARYRQALQRAARHEPAQADQWPKVFDPLAEQVRAQCLPLPLLEALLDAFEQDARNPRYATRERLLDYCARSANPVGRLLLHLYGVDDARSLAESDAICTALQLINFWQDLSIDLPRGRIYVPDADAAAHGLDASRLWTVGDTRESRALVRDLVRWAAEFMARGSALPARLPGRVGWELRLVVQGGWRILEKIADMRYATVAPGRRPRLNLGDAAVLLWRALTMPMQRLHAGRFQ